MNGPAQLTRFDIGPLSEWRCPTLGSFPEIIQSAEGWLARRFGIADLSIIERYRLLRCCEDAVERLIPLYLEYKEKKIGNGYLFDPVIEGAVMWCAETLDLAPNFILDHLDKNNRVASNELQAWIAIERDRLHGI